MRKMMMVFLLCFLIIGLSGCAKKEEEPVIEETEETVNEAEKEEEFDVEKYLRELPDDPWDRKDIVINPFSDLLNREVWEEFRNDAEEGKKTAVIVAPITIEGDPIYMYVEYDGTGFSVTQDISHDAYRGTDTPVTYRYERKYLYEYHFETKEETNGGLRPFDHYIAFLSDQVYENEEEIKEAMANREVDWLTLWAYQNVR